ncbi:MAG: hypothetical protein EOS52_23685 [Mesorhizobium sp.]|uniref:hypothetical protein n=1 Tax=Mesorhizobium sp. TaxID=1871066 RepID=UPI000FE887CB|nr:hypothetical protein [Mesorhizobium sp.]RWC10774.1 MAG: hypothetical protein EOS52_23685 [Mesorhizobium sp.]
MGTKLGITIYEETKEVAFRFTDAFDNVIGEIAMDQNGLIGFISQLIAAHGRIKSGGTATPSQVASGVLKLPPPLAYKRVTAARNTKSGLPILGFELSPELWLSFEIQPEAAKGLRRALLPRSDRPGGSH